MVEIWLEEYKDQLTKLLHPKPYKISTGHLWWKREETIKSTPETTPEELALFSRISATAFIKKVKMV
ncbi:hypothetical protein AVV36_gp016 [Pectobacterium bacteriophage PM2]|uniref:Uncharacterized protein n=1 Tax=Pectobacterium bacteriophage PM2 TaxID=1429794 RepID=A0A0A0Q0G3_9CAUD|nr:hypothetical protein AVV36_gp016 [Pectobacterium bacteriophage PM2]AHY24978.1 hypothetical protein PM2_016 [Pectobacterium bacteriophage PM2]